MKTDSQQPATVTEAQAQGTLAAPTGYVPSTTRLAKWHRAQCNGDWEHMYGVTIETTDNPGWWVKIELDGTTAANLTGKGQRDGMTWEVADGTLQGYDEETGNLEGLLCLLMDVIEAHNAAPSRAANNPKATT